MGLMVIRAEIMSRGELLTRVTSDSNFINCFPQAGPAYYCHISTCHYISSTRSYIFRNMTFHLHGNLHLSKKDVSFHFQVTFSVRAFAGGGGDVA